MNEEYTKDLAKISSSLVSLLVVVVLLLVLMNVWSRGGIPFIHGVDKASWVDADKKAITVSEESTPPPAVDEEDIDSFIGREADGAPSWTKVRPGGY